MVMLVACRPRSQDHLLDARRYSILEDMRRSDCPIAATLDLLGDRWTLVVLRDILLVHHYAFSQIAAKEGIATNILMDRPNAWWRRTLLERRVDDADRRRTTCRPSARSGLFPSWWTSSSGATPTPTRRHGLRRPKRLRTIGMR